MENVTTTRLPGWVQTKFNDFATDDILPATAVDRLQEDSNLLSRAILELHQIYHYPIIATAAHTLSVVASADTVTLADNIQFAVGGMVFDTHDLDTRAITIPDNATRFLRAEIDDACGLIVDYGDPANGNIIDPLARKLVCRLSLVEGAETDTEGTGGGQSSPTSMRILKAVKATAGTVPTVTLYVNDGHDPNVTTVADHEAADPAHAASKVSFDNTVAQLDGAPGRVQAAIEALVTRLTTAANTLTTAIAAHAAADPAHMAAKIGFDNTTAALAGSPSKVQAAIEALADISPITGRILITPSGGNSFYGIGEIDISAHGFTSADAYHVVFTAEAAQAGAVPENLGPVFVPFLISKSATLIKLIVFDIASTAYTCQIPVNYAIFKTGR